MKHDIPRLFLGTWQHGKWLSTEDSKAHERIFEHALERGLQAFDTAARYGKGDAEKLLGKVVSGARERVFLATKFSAEHSKPRLIRWSLEHSLRNLKTDYIDLLYQHWPSPSLHGDRVIETLLELKEEGKIRFIGVSNWRKEEFEECSLVGNIDAVQNCHNILWRDSDWIPAQYPHLAFCAYSPVSSGLLHLSAPQRNTPEHIANRAKHVFLTTEFADSIAQARGQLREIANESGYSVHALAMLWILHQATVRSIVFGVSKVEQLHENCLLVEENPTPELLAKLDDISKAFHSQVTLPVSSWNFHTRVPHLARA